MGFMLELRRAFRRVLRTPGASAAAVIVLGLGIGLSTMMFSIVTGVFYRGLGVPDEDRVRVLEMRSVVEDDESATLPAVLGSLLLDSLDSAESMVAYQGGAANVVWRDRRARLEANYMTGDAMTFLGAAPIMGRGLEPSDDDPTAETPLVLGYRSWAGDFAGDASIVGRQLSVNGMPATVIGVMPEGFRFPQDADAWMPLRSMPGTQGGRPTGEWTVVARLSPGVTLDGFHAELATHAQRLAGADLGPDEDPLPPDLELASQTLIERNTGDWMRPIFAIMSAAIALVLLVACANVANLLMAMASTRSGEVGLRAALGGTRGRVVLPFFLEALVLALGGAAFGLVLAVFGVQGLSAWMGPIGFPYFIRFEVDGAAMAFTTALAVATALVTAVAPALTALAVAPRTTLQESGSGGATKRLGRMMRGLVVAEVAFSSAVLVGSGVAAKSLWGLSRLDLGFDPDPVITARATLIEPGYPDASARELFARDLLAELAEAPELEAAALAETLPGAGAVDLRMEVEGVTYLSPEDRTSASIKPVSPRFFDVLDAPALQGRVFDDGDVAGSLPVALVDESLARLAFAGMSPIGARVRMPNDSIYRTVVGIVPDLTPQGLGAGTDPGGLYLPIAQAMSESVAILIRPAGVAPEAAIRAMLAATERVDPDLPLDLVAPLSDRIAEDTWVYQAFGTVFVFFGAAGLLMAGVGLYGVLSFSIARRRWELGLRSALGARSAQLISLVTRQAFGQIVAGLAVGLTVGWYASSILAGVSFGVDPRTPWILVWVGVVVAIVGAGATLMPAGAALRANPAGIMRNR